MSYISINGKELKTINIYGKEIDYNIDIFCEQYEKKNTLPSPKIVCTVSGELITCFGTNLHNKVKKYGSIRKLLTEFISRKHKQKDIVSQSLKEVTIVTPKAVSSVNNLKEVPQVTNIVTTNNLTDISPDEEIDELSEEDTSSFIIDNEDEEVSMHVTEAELLGDESLCWD